MASTPRTQGSSEAEKVPIARDVEDTAIARGPRREGASFLARGMMAGMNEGIHDRSALWRYHELTKHSPASVASSARGLDWSIKPRPFKLYRDLLPIPPPADIGRLCRLSNGILRRRRDPTGERHGFRAAACTGALYHIELYLATAEREELRPGLYHYGAHDHALRRLREGDVRGSLVAATSGSEVVAAAPLILVLTSTFWRNAWKYQARAYRHAFWDSGAVLANLLALLAADGTPASVLMGFADDDVGRLLGVDGVREAAVAIVAVGDGALTPPAAAPLAELVLPTEPLSATEVRYREIEDAHAASALTMVQVAGWRERAGTASHDVPPRLGDADIDGVIERRRSTRRFDPRPIRRAELESLLAAATAPIPGDAFTPEAVTPFFVVNGVDGVERGLYRADLSPIRVGDARRLGGALALWQGLGAEAAFDLYFLADLGDVLERLGERGYRVAQMAGGIAGGRVDLAAIALGLGATGLTFFDDEVTLAFEPAARGRGVMYLAAVGHRA